MEMAWKDGSSGTSPRQGQGLWIQQASLLMQVHRALSWLNLSDSRAKLAPKPEYVQRYTRYRQLLHRVGRTLNAPELARVAPALKSQAASEPTSFLPHSQASEKMRRPWQQSRLSSSGRESG